MDRPLTTHALARLLLAGPDAPLEYHYDEDGNAHPIIPDAPKPEPLPERASADRAGWTFTDSAAADSTARAVGVLTWKHAATWGADVQDDPIHTVHRALATFEPPADHAPTPRYAVRPAFGGRIGAWAVLDERGEPWKDEIGRSAWERDVADALCGRLNAGGVPDGE